MRTAPGLLLRNTYRVTRSASSARYRATADHAPQITGIDSGKDALASRFDLLKSEIARLAWSDEISEAFGGIKSGLERKADRIEDFDAAVAAHALANGYVLVTANLKHPQRAGSSAAPHS